MKKILAVLLSLVGAGVLAVAINYTFFGPDLPLVLRLIFFFLLFADAVCYFVAAWGIFKKIKKIYPLTIALLVINALGIIFDDIGFVDIATAGVNIVIIILLIYDHQKTTISH